ncbi:MAG: CDP-diacylglycerol--glycerol-3-phosphate 3-phosphatidyltransferase [Lachnospiraceae bacterium]|nr:CDP-diacylglycerol--glycerol-3-phosphate 3-phosphatidyltransferase [Lachnospiraceae bacterium]
MNIANKLTLLRIIMIPVFLVFLIPNEIPGLAEWVNSAGESVQVLFSWIALGIFVLASFTDFLDGFIARKYNMISNFGKFMDPLADKLLVCSALIGLMSLQKLNIWFVLIIIARDFIISGFRLVAAERGVVIAAGMSGKIKTALQMILIGCLIPTIHIPFYSIFLLVLEIIVLILTIFSLFEYIIKNRTVLSDVTTKK